MNSEPILEVRHLNVWYRPSGVLCRGRRAGAPRREL